jgi:hypothetical protein
MGIFQPFPSLHQSPKDRRALLLLKDHSRSHKDHHTLWCLLLAFTMLQNFGEVQWESKLHEQMNTKM